VTCCPHVHAVFAFAAAVDELIASIAASTYPPGEYASTGQVHSWAWGWGSCGELWVALGAEEDAHQVLVACRILQRDGTELGHIDDLEPASSMVSQDQWSRLQGALVLAQG